MADSPAPIPPGWLPGGAAPSPLLSSYQPMKQAPPPLPPAQEDPAVLAARAAHQTYLDTIQAARAEWDVTDLSKAEKITTAYAALDAELTRLYADLDTRRRNRMTYLEAQIPVGPGIPEDATPADRAVLATAFRAAFDRAKAAGHAERGQLLADAERFDDDAMRRATLTVCLDEGMNDLVKEWTLTRGGTLANLFTEGAALREALAGMGPDRGWVWQAFMRPREPEEMRALPTLRAAAERQRERAARDARPSYYSN